MARIKREFIQLDQRLFNDPRFYMLTGFEQLVYIKLISMAKQTDNKIPKDFKAIALYMRIKEEEVEFYLSQIGYQKVNIGSQSVLKNGTFGSHSVLNRCEIGVKSAINRCEIGVKSAIKRIKAVFDNFNENKYFYYFDNFDLRYRQNSKNSGGEEEEEEDKEEDIVINNPTGSVNKSVENSKSSLTEIEKEVLKQVYNRGVNIYALLEEFKNKHRIYPPKEILIDICQQGLTLEQKGEIKSGLYPYLKASLHRAYLDMEHNQWKKEGVAKSIKEILVDIGR